MPPVPEASAGWRTRRESRYVAASMRLFAFTCGWVTGPASGFLEGASGRLRVPVPVFLVRHPRGDVLFDTGIHPDAGRDPAARLGWLAQVFRIELAPGEDVGGRLAAVDIDPAGITHLVTSHLHFDHVGGNAAIPNARLVVQRAEWDAGRDPDLARANTYDRRDYDLGHDVLAVEGEHDLFGDGRVVCLPTHGHTPGHQSLRLRLDAGEVVLAADACYLRRTLEALHLPGIVHDRAGMLASLERLRALQAAGARIVFGHDPELWATVPQAPAEVRLGARG
jgi:glyoxylase-like metal-dependent hydrolase (beta-lactamase superfamily II)